MLYLEGDNSRCPTLALRQLLLPMLHGWLSTVSDRLFHTLSEHSESLGKVVAVELLRSPFYLCVLPRILTLLSDEMHY